ncbi:hypothetical protein ABPG75_001007 [Micractinium tetrahymenae]
MSGSGEPEGAPDRGSEEEKSASDQEGEPQEAEGQSDEESEGSEQEEEESTSEEKEEEEEDDEPLSKRPSWNSKHELPQPTAPARKRTQRFPKIPRSERCGTCDNCLNPQRKKACLVARARMEARMKQGATAGDGSSGGPTARPRGTSAPAKPPAPATAVAASADEDPFARSLTGILASNGGVAQERHVPLLLQLVKRARTKPHRIALLTVLQLSSGDVLRSAVAGGLLLELQTWLSEFVAEGKQAMVQKALACLDKLPVTLASLQAPCELGKIVGRLRKHESFGSAVIEPAKRLVARWKAMVDAAVKSGVGGSNSSRSAHPQRFPPVAIRPAGCQLHVVDLSCGTAVAMLLGHAKSLLQQCPACLAHVMPCLPRLSSEHLALRSTLEQHASAAALPPRVRHTQCRTPDVAPCSLPCLPCPGLCSAAPAANAAKAAAPAATKAAAAPAFKAAAAPAAKAAASGGAAGQLDRQSSGGAAAAMEDGDLFKSTDRQRAGIKDAVPSVKKTVTIKTLTVEPTRGVKPAEGASSSHPAGAGGKAEGGSSGSGAAGAVRTDVSKVSASPFAALSSLGGLGSGVTVLGGGSTGGLLGTPLSSLGPVMSTAKERAAAAARRVPSPEPRERKEKKKKVAWVGEEAMVGVRWFRKDDPPAAAQKDVDLTKAPAAPLAAPAREASPPGFESAAKKEHLSEAEALRRHRQEEDQERSEMAQRLERMQPTTAWMSPAINDATSPAEVANMAAPPAAGEESTEAAAAAARRQQVPAALYAKMADIPDTPGEPGPMADHGVVQHLSTIPRIPLSLEEAAVQQQQQQQSQQSQQPQPQGAGAPQPQQPQQQQPQQLAPPNLQLSQQQHHQQHQQQRRLGGQVPGAPPAAMQQQAMALPQQQAAPQLAEIGAALAQLAASGILKPAGGASHAGSGPAVQPPAQQRPQQPGFPQQQGFRQQQGVQPLALQQQPMGQPGLPPPRGPQLAWPPPPPGQLSRGPQLAQPPRPAGQLPLQGMMPPGQPPPPRGMLPGQPLQPPGRPPPVGGPPPHLQGRPPPPHLQGQPRPPPGPQTGQPRPPYGNQRTCRYFNTPQGCFAGDRCKFAHIPVPGGPGMENGRGGVGAKRPAEGDLGQRPGKQPRGTGWGGRP